MKFKNYIEQKDYQTKIAGLIYLAENINTLNEADLNEGLNDWLNKIGLDAKKEKGLINYFWNFTKGAGKLVLAAIRKDKEEVKNIASTINQKDCINFILKLDLATLHIITTPLHFIEAVTGWSIEPIVKDKLKSANDKLKIFFNAIGTVKDSIIKLANPKKTKSYLKLVGKLQNAVPPVN